MQIVYHIGAHCTDQDALHASLVKNKTALVQKQVALPHPRKYRNVIRENLQAMAKGARPDMSGEELLADILGDSDAERMILTNANFICVPNRIFEGGDFYALAVEKLQAFGTLFQGHEIELSICMRDPGTFIPAAYGKSHGRSFQRFMAGAAPSVVQWSGLIHRMRTVLPRAKITAWCNEDTPFVWPKILRHLIGVDAEEPINAGYDLIGSLLTEIGTQKMQNYFKTNPPNSEKERQRVLAAFLEHYANPDAVEEEITLPGWTNDLLTRLSDLYDEDVNPIISRSEFKSLSRPCEGQPQIYMPKASLYISKIASSSAISFWSRLRRVMSLRMTFVSYPRPLASAMTSFCCSARSFFSASKRSIRSMNCRNSSAVTR